MRQAIRRVVRRPRSVAAGFSTRYWRPIGVGRPRLIAGKLLELHDRMTRSAEPLPLAYGFCTP